MSRHELEELDKMFLDVNDPNYEEPEKYDEAHRPRLEKMPEYQLYKGEMAKIIPLRNACIRRYFEKFKYNRRKREGIVEAAECAEAQI